MHGRLTTQWSATVVAVSACCVSVIGLLGVWTYTRQVRQRFPEGLGEKEVERHDAFILLKGEGDVRGRGVADQRATIIQVVEKGTGAPISRALVGVLEGAGWKKWTFSKVTGDDGRCTVEGDIRGRYVSAVSSCWLPSVPVLVPDSWSDEVWTVEMVEGGSLEVDVVDADGVPVERAFVEVYPSSRGEAPPVPWLSFGYVNDAIPPPPLGIRSVTGKDGVVIIKPLPTMVDLVATASIAVPEVSAHVVIRKQNVTEKIILRAPNRGALRGVLEWSDGTPVQAKVQALVGVDPLNSRMTYSDPSGRFLLSGLPVGSVSWRTVDGVIRRATIVPGETTDAGAVRLPRMGKVSGIIQCDPSTVAPDLTLLRVNVYSSEGVRTSARVRQDGSFEVVAPCGRCTYRILTNQGVAEEGAVLVPGPTLDFNASDLFGTVVLAGSLLDRGESTSVILVDASRGSGAGIEVGTGSRYLQCSGDKGSTAITPVLPGEYTVFLRSKNRLRPLGTVRLAAGETTTVPNQQHERGRLEITVLDTSGRPLGGVVAHVAPAMACSLPPNINLSGTTGRNGEVVFRIPGGQWDVDISYPLPEQGYQRRIILEDASAFDVKFIVPEQGTVRGAVLRNGLPVENARLVLLPTGGGFKAQEHFEVTSGPLGEFMFRALPPGEYFGMALAGEVNGLASLGSRIDVSPGGDDFVAFELGDSSGSIEFLLGGRPVMRLDEVIAITSTGVARMSPMSGKPQELKVPFMSGLVVFLVRGDWNAAFRPDSMGERLYSAVLVGDYDPFGRNVADIGGGTVVVSCVSTAEALPQLRLCSVGSVDLVEAGYSRLLDYSTNGMVRTFRSIPRGATVRLEGYDDWKGIVTKQVVIENGGVTQITWP